VIIKWLRKLSVAKKLAIIISLIFLILLLGLANFWLSMRIMSGIRAYVGGEGLWSKSQKEAVTNLIRYSVTFDEVDYQAYREFLQVPLGDKQARLELEKKEYNYELTRQGIIQGGNSPDDVDDMIFLYRRFRRVSYMDIAIRDWAQGDALIEKLMDKGEKIHAIISTTGDEDDPMAQDVRLDELSELVMEVYALDKELTTLENHFSATLSEGSRWIRDVLFVVTIILSILLGSFTLFISLYISQMIVEVDKKKNEFIYLVSHQLKTPLTSSSWYSELLLQDHKIDKEKRRSYLLEISNTNKRMVDLVNTLLNVSRIEMGTFVVNPVMSSLTSLIDEVIASFAVQKMKRNIEIQKQYQEGLPSIAIDPQTIRIVVSNLLSNAIKYSYDGGKVTVSLSKKGSFVQIKVQDEGIGIPKSEQGRLFEKFFRASNAKTLDTDGSGLGLYIVESVVKNVGGTLSYTSAEGKGTSFIVSFPLEGLKKKRKKE
jgi:signal transduction histidine kinase